MGNEIFTLFIMLFVFGFFECMNSIGMCIYFTQQKYKHPGLVFVPIYKYYYFSKNSFGFCPITMGFQLPNIILPLLYLLSIVMFFIGLEPFLIVIMFNIFYIGCIYRGIFIGNGCKEVFMLTVMSVLGFSFITLPYIAIRNYRKSKTVQKSEKGK